MYVPRNSLLNRNVAEAARHGGSRSPRNKYGVAFASAMLVLLLIAALVLQKSESKDQAAAPARYAHDLAQLWSWSDSVFVGGAKTAEWTLRFDAALSEGMSLAQLSDSVFSDADGVIKTERIVTNGGNSVSGQYTALIGESTDAARLSLHQTGQSGNGMTVILLLESGVEDSTEQGLQAALKQLGSLLAKMSDEWTLTMKTHGYSDKQEGAKTLERIARGRILEQYEDGGTRSVTMLSDALLSSKALGHNRHANLQVAEHSSTETARNELTIGVPLISGDFSSVRTTEERAD
ncbi:hypothetical protein [Paenibacillus sp. PAMC21692]|uniref:hypothetical protein n=1 Tax=Paenibacillus sp. PAMC21692 TaxID=2762320 RepID=UPI00164E5D14|nr:hypothetical protein [Paenibacillus sp. PAMC21692]QNK59640.1 hypothetical protein H7F31_12705 [Paenibacillus sp. PAMC21692]